MKTMNWIFASLLLLACSGAAQAQTGKEGSTVHAAQTTMTMPQEHADKGAAALDTQREKVRSRYF